MSTPAYQIPAIPIVNQGNLYVNGLQVTAGALNADNLTTGTLIIANGAARDSTNVNDIVLPTTVLPTAANPNNLPTDANAPFYTLNPAVNGRNGLDVGTIAIDTLYAVYAIAASGEQSSKNTNLIQPGVLLSTNFSTPTLPYGYDMYRRIGTVLTAHAAARFVYFAQRGNGAQRDTWYNVPFTVLSGATGAGTDALTSFNLTSTAAGTANVVPITASKAYILSALTADAGGTRTAVYAANNTVTIANAATAGMVITSSPASTVTSASLIIPISSTAGIMPMKAYYALSNTSASLSVSVQGFLDLL